MQQIALFDTNLVSVFFPFITFMYGQAIALVREQSWLSCLTFLERLVATRTEVDPKQSLQLQQSELHNLKEFKA